MTKTDDYLVSYILAETVSKAPNEGIQSVKLYPADPTSEVESSLFIAVDRESGNKELCAYGKKEQVEESVEADVDNENEYEHKKPQMQGDQGEDETQCAGE